MAAETIQCWSCGTRMTLDELSTNDGDCPECDVEIALAEYLKKALAENAALRAQLPSLGVEAVEVVACIDLDTDAGVVLYAGRESHLDDELLMTVAQHQRILAAATHPAGQVADDLNMVKVSRELLEQIAVELEHDNDRYFLGRELRALLGVKS